MRSPGRFQQQLNLLLLDQGTYLGGEGHEVVIGKYALPELPPIGVVLEPEDLADERDYFMNRWPYLNEDKLSREELYAFYQMGRKYGAMVSRYNEMQRETRSPRYIAERTPIAQIVKEKTKRRLRSLMPLADNAPSVQTS